MLTGHARQATQALREAGLVPPAGVDLTDAQRATLGGDLSDLPDLPLDLRNWLLVGAPLRTWAPGSALDCKLCWLCPDSGVYPGTVGWKALYVFQLPVIDKCQELGVAWSTGHGVKRGIAISIQPAIKHSVLVLPALRLRLMCRGKPRRAWMAARRRGCRRCASGTPSPPWSSC